MKWSATHSDLPLFYQWDDEVVVYDPVSGDTHLLGHVAWACLKFVTKKPRSLNEICQAIAIDYDLPCDKELKVYINTTLKELRGLMLVREEWAQS